MRPIKTALCALTMLLGLLSVTEAEAEERRLLQYRYVSDASVPTFPPPGWCANAPFAANGYVEGDLTGFLTLPSGRTILPKRHRGFTRGWARACLQITDFAFTPMVAEVRIHWEIHVYGEGTFTAHGVCKPTNGGVPAPGVVLGGCVMTLSSTPPGYLGGNLVESGVLFNPFGVPGFELSSSIFTFHLFEAGD